jgi:predicted kinase
MDHPTLYLMLGYPGAGKTTISKEITKRTGAVHLWADHERRAMFSEPCHSKAESDELYAALNTRTDQLLGEGSSVVFF